VSFDGPAAGAVAGVALAAVVVGALLVPGAFGTDESDVDWPPFHATYEEEGISGNHLATTRYELDYSSQERWVDVVVATGEVRRPRMHPAETPLGPMTTARFTDVAIATTKGMVRRDLSDGSIELVQTLELPCPPASLPALVQCLPGRDAIAEVTTTRLGEHRLPTSMTVEHDGRLVGSYHLTSIDWE
jgi:hypothetical protein